MSVGNKTVGRIRVQREIQIQRLNIFYRVFDSVDMRRNASTHKLLSDTEDSVFLEEEENASTGSSNDVISQASDQEQRTDQNHNRLAIMRNQLHFRLVGRPVGRPSRSAFQALFGQFWPFLRAFRSFEEILGQNFIFSLDVPLGGLRRRRSSRRTK